jgi:hypothetical protein
LLRPPGAAIDAVAGGAPAALTDALTDALAGGLRPSGGPIVLGETPPGAQR